VSEYDLGTARGRIEIDASGAEAGFQRAQQGADQTTAKMQQTGQAMTAAGRSMTLLGAALVGAVGLAVKASADFEKEISKFQAAAQETPEVLDEVREKALQIGRDTSFGAGQAAEAITALSYAGLETTDILEGAADAAVALAEAGELEVAEAASIAAAAMNIWQLEAHELEKVSNSLIGVFANSDTMVDQLGEAIEQVGATAATLGISLEDTAVALGLLADRGIKGSKAGTTLNRMLLNLQPSSDKAATAMQELGLITEDGSNSFFDAEGNMKSLSDVSETLQGALQGLTNEQKTAYLETIFGTRAIAAATAMADNGAEGFNDLAEAMGEVSAADVAAEKLDNLSGAMTILKGTVETALISAGSPFQDALKGVVQSITGLINAFAQMDPKWQKFIVFAAAGLGALLLIMGTFLMVAGTILKTAATFGILAKALHLGPLLVKLAAGFKLLWASVLGPIGLVVLAVIGLAYLIYRYWDEIVAFTKAAWSSFKDFILGAVEGVLGWLKDNWKMLLIGILLGPFGLLIAMVVRHWESIKEAFSSGIDAAIKFFQDLPRRIGYFLGAALRFLIDWHSNMLEGAVNVGKSVLGAIGNFFSQLPRRIGYFLGASLRFLIVWSARAILFAIDTGSKFLGWIVNFFSELPGRIKRFLEAAVRRISLWAVQAVLKARDMGKRFIDSIVQFLRDLPGAVSRLLSRTLQRVISFARQAPGKAAEMARNFVSAIRNKLRELPSLLRDLVKRGLDALSNLAKAAYRRARRFASELWEGFKAGLGISSPSFIEKALTQITKAMDYQSSRMASQVRDLQNLSRSIPDIASDVSVRAMLDNRPTASASTFAGNVVTSKSMVGPRFTVERLVVNNPVGETTDESVTRTLRKLSYLGGQE